jgi:hypothetical protein
MAFNIVDLNFSKLVLAYANTGFLTYIVDNIPVKIYNMNKLGM